jgi:hypothetical protein
VLALKYSERIPQIFNDALELYLVLHPGEELLQQFLRDALLHHEQICAQSEDQDENLDNSCVVYLRQIGAINGKEDAQIIINAYEHSEYFMWPIGLKSIEVQK